MCFSCLSRSFLDHFSSISRFFLFYLFLLIDFCRCFFQVNVEITPHSSPVKTAVFDPAEQSSPSVKEVTSQALKGKNFKRRKLPNPRFRGDDFTNPSGKQAKVKDPTIVDPLRPYDPDQHQTFRRFMLQLPGEKQVVELKSGLGSASVDWFGTLYTCGEWLDGMVRQFIFRRIYDVKVWFSICHN